MLITVARVAEDGYVLVVLFTYFLVFSVHRFYHVPVPIFAKLSTQRGMS